MENKREKLWEKGLNALKEELRQEKNHELTGDAETDFPELFENDLDTDDKTGNNFSVYLQEREKENEYLKKSMIEDFKDNVEVGKDKSIYDKRVKRSLFKKIIDALFNNDAV